MKYFGIIISLFLVTNVFAQQQSQDEAKQFQEAIDTEIENYTSMLDLEYWQVFYVDSILNHNYSQMKIEIEALGKAKVNNSGAYEAVQDKWSEASYQAFSKVLDEKQWNKYLKNGAKREKKARDKRAAKLE